MPYLTGYKTDPGLRRSNNEDCFGVASERDVSPVRLAERGYLVSVADGVGGQAAGEVASQTAVTRLQEAYYTLPFTDPQDTLRRAVIEANHAVWQVAQRSDRAGMASTIVAAVAKDARLYLAWLGDSRAYLVQPLTAELLTRDHTVVNELVQAGALTPAEAETHPHRHVISRSLGSKEEVDVATAAGPFEPGQTLVLCTDGLSNQAPLEQIAQTVRGLPPQLAAEHLVALANAAGGIDNVTVVVMRSPGETRIGGAVTGTVGGLPALWKRFPLALAAASIIVLLVLFSVVLLAQGSGRIAPAQVIRDLPETSSSLLPSKTPGPVKAINTIAPIPPTSTTAPPQKKADATLRDPLGKSPRTFIYRQRNQSSGITRVPLDDNSVRLTVHGEPSLGESTGVSIAGGKIPSRLWYEVDYQGPGGSHLNVWVACPYVFFIAENEFAKCLN